MNDTYCNPQDLHNLTVAATKVNQKGCYDLVTSFMETNMGIIAGVAFGIAFSQVILWSGLAFPLSPAHFSWSADSLAASLCLGKS